MTNFFIIQVKKSKRKKEALHIPEGKKVLLYTPTWRDSSLDENGAFSLPDGFDVNVLMDMLGSDYILFISRPSPNWSDKNKR